MGNVRVVAARSLGRVLGESRSLRAVLPPVLPSLTPPDQRLLQELCYGTLRWYPRLQRLLDRLLTRPLKAGEQELQALLLTSLYQFLYLRVPEYAAVSEAVTATRSLHKPWAAGLVNAVMRRLQRSQTALLQELAQDDVFSTAHPAWLLEQLRLDWPQDWRAIVDANNARPPLGLRVNLARTTRAAYLQRLREAGAEAKAAVFSPAGIMLTQPRAVDELPGFQDGLVSVQDPAAQLAAGLLELQPGQRVLDACAAPGGKTCHLLESEPQLGHLLALDLDAERLRRVQENLQRLGLQASTVVGEVARPEAWWDDVPYDRILLDAPCSGTGVIRRHPDIKVLRRAADVAPLASRQRAMLAKLWPLLAPGGILIYATCSILKRENSLVVQDFLADHTDARERPILAAWGRPERFGRQILPGEHDMDGFYYASLEKVH